MVSFNSETCPDYKRNESLISMFSLKRKKYIEKSFGQIGVKYLLPNNDFNLFSHNNSLGKECFQEEKLTHSQGSRNQDRMFMKSSSFWIFLPVSF